MPHMLSYGNAHLATAPCLQKHILLSVNTLSCLLQSRYGVRTSLQNVLPNCEEPEQLVALKSISNDGLTDAVCVVECEREIQDRR